MMKQFLAALAALALVFAIFYLRGGSGKTEKYQAEYTDVFDTYTYFIAYTDGKREFDEYDTLVYEELCRLHQLFDIYNEYEGISNLKTVNDHAGIAPVKVDDSLLDLVEFSLQMGEQTDYAFHAAMGPVLRIWHEHRLAAELYPEEAALPSRSELEAAAKLSDPAKVQIDREAGTIFLQEKGMALDVGAVAKGYAAQQSLNLAEAQGLTSGILSVGGDLCLLGAPLDDRVEWNVGVQMPQEDAQELYDNLYLTGPCSVVTSGDYQRYFLVDGKPYHHIIDPSTLFPAAQVKSVTVFHPDGGMADLLSTAAFILPQPQGQAIILEQGGEALWIFADGTSIATEGYQAVSKRFAEASE